MTKGLDRSASPEGELSSSDTGDEVQRRYRYQNTYTCVPLILMYSGQYNYKHIMCEQHEDILACTTYDKFHGYQVKTRDAANNELTLSDKDVLKSLLRFIKLDCDYPEKFEKFILVANYDFPWKNRANNITNFVNQAKDGNGEFLPKGAEEYIKKLTKLSKLSRDSIIQTLKKVECQPAPAINDIESVIRDAYLPKIKECKSLVKAQANAILTDLIKMIYDASSKNVKDSVRYYVSLLPDPQVVLIDEQLLTKRITKQSVENTIKKHCALQFSLTVKQRTVGASKVGTIEIVRKKMKDGGIVSPEIDQMEDLIASTEHYILENMILEDDVPNSFNRNLEHVESLVLTECAEAKTHAIDTGENPFGQKMLLLIEDRLRHLADSKPNDVRNFPYYMLKGIVGILARACKVSFSLREWN